MEATRYEGALNEISRSEGCLGSAAGSIAYLETILSDGSLNTANLSEGSLFEILSEGCFLKEGDFSCCCCAMMT